MLSLSGLSASSSLSFVRVLLASSYFAFCFFRSLLLGFASQWLFQCFGSSFRLYRFPHSLQPDFSCFPSWFRYLAFCLFPFILPSFTPTAVPTMLPSVHFLASVSLSGFSACLPLSFVHFSPLLITQHSALSFPFFLISPGSGYHQCLFPLWYSLLPCFPLDSGTQRPAFPFSDHCFVLQVLLQCLSFFLSDFS